MRILERHEADNVMMVTARSRLSRTLKNQPGFTALDISGERYSLYAVDRSKLPQGS